MNSLIYNRTIAYINHNGFVFKKSDKPGALQSVFWTSASIVF